MFIPIKDGILRCFTFISFRVWSCVIHAHPILLLKGSCDLDNADIYRGIWRGTSFQKKKTCCFPWVFYSSFLLSLLLRTCNTGHLEHSRMCRSYQPSGLPFFLPFFPRSLLSRPGSPRERDDFSKTSWDHSGFARRHIGIRYWALKKIGQNCQGGGLL